MAENHHLLQPLLYTKAATTTPQDDLMKVISPNSGIIFRLSLVSFITIVSIWANHEASKGYAVTVINEAGNTFSGKRFQLFYMSNDEATRIVIKASKIVENFLYPNNNHPKKQVNHIIIKLVAQNLTDQVTVDSEVAHEFVLNISPLIMESTNFGHDMFLVVRLGIARIWLWDGQGKAPKSLINGILEFITSNLGDQLSNLKGAGFAIKDSSRAMAEFLKYCEDRQPGFITKLNQAMKDGWHDDQLDIALGMPVQHLLMNITTTPSCSAFLAKQHVT